MPLVGFMGIHDPGRISTLTNLPGQDKGRRKRLLPLVPGHIFSGQQLQVRLLTRDCYSHEPPGALVPVELMKLVNSVGWTTLGTAKCCPLCWSIIIKPNGSSLPDPLPQPPVGQASEKQREALKKGRQVKDKRLDSQAGIIREKIRDVSASLEPFTVQDIMELVGAPRTSVRKIFQELIKTGEIISSEVGGSGRGNRTTYEKAT